MPQVKMLDLREHGKRYYFRVSSGDDFNGAITALKNAFHYTIRTWNPDTKEWSVPATEESEEKLSVIFPNAANVFLGIKAQLRMF